MRSVRLAKRTNWDIKRDMEIGFLIMRKKWARDLLKEKGLTQPGQETTGEYERVKYNISIGPRGGVRIRERRVTLDDIN